MKRVILLFSIFLLATPAFAKNVKVEAMSDFTTANPPETWQVKIVEGFVTKDGFTINSDSIIEGNITDVSDPKRLKRNAAFVFVPTKYFDSKGENWYNIERNVAGKYSSMTDVTAASIAKSGAVIVGNKLVDGFFGPGLALVEGAVKNEEGNRAKSAVKSVYESTPLSYIDKGKELEIKKGQVFIMSFKVDNEQQAQDKPNYEYEME